jgi:hypothetical protein
MSFMAVIEEIIRVEAEGRISFGDYVSTEKRKVADFEVDGDLYKVKTCNEITRLEKNGKLLLETVPGTAVHNLRVTAEAVTFGLEGFEDTRVTLELAPGESYRIMINETNLGFVKANMSGKVIFSTELEDEAQSIEIIKA